MVAGANGGVERWSADELLGELREFEAALRDGGLAENTVQTYVGRSEIFVRWLSGGYLPRGPNEAQGRAPKLALATVGREALRDLGGRWTREQIAEVLREYGVLTSFDASLRELQRVTGASADLGNAGHRTAVIAWLRAWGCRHLRRADERRTDQALEGWWHDWRGHLPGVTTAITELGDTELHDLAAQFDALASARVAARSIGGRDVDVRFGDTATAKTLYAIRPQAMLPWDAPIRLAFGWTRGGGAAYEELLRLAADALQALAARLGTPMAALPTALGRAESSPPKLVDEFLWVTVTRRIGLDWMGNRQ
jgi:hypothetical protein